MKITTRDFGFDLAMLARAGAVSSHWPDVRYYGKDGELHNLAGDPLQWRNLWDDAGYAKIKSDLNADLRDKRPPSRMTRLMVESPV